MRDDDERVRFTYVIVPEGHSAYASIKSHDDKNSFRGVVELFVRFMFSRLINRSGVWVLEPNNKLRFLSSDIHKVQKTDIQYFFDLDSKCDGRELKPIDFIKKSLSLELKNFLKFQMCFQQSDFLHMDSLKLPIIITHKQFRDQFDEHHHHTLTPLLSSTLLNASSSHHDDNRNDELFHIVSSFISNISGDYLTTIPNNIHTVSECLNTIENQYANLEKMVHKIFLELEVATSHGTEVTLENAIQTIQLLEVKNQNQEHILDGHESTNGDDANRTLHKENISLKEKIRDLTNQVKKLKSVNIENDAKRNGELKALKTINSASLQKLQKTIDEQKVLIIGLQRQVGDLNQKCLVMERDTTLLRNNILEAGETLESPSSSRASSTNRIQSLMNNAELSVNLQISQTETQNALSQLNVQGQEISQLRLQVQTLNALNSELISNNKIASDEQLVLRESIAKHCHDVRMLLSSSPTSSENCTLESVVLEMKDFLQKSSAVLTQLIPSESDEGVSQSIATLFFFMFQKIADKPQSSNDVQELALPNDAGLSSVAYLNVLSGHDTNDDDGVINRMNAQKQELEALRKKNALLTTRVRTLAALNEESVQKLEVLPTESRELDEQVKAALNNHISELQKNIQDLKNEVEKAKAGRKEFEEVNGRLNEELSRLKQENSVMKEENEKSPHQAPRQIIALGKEKNFEKENIVLHEKIAELEETIYELQTHGNMTSSEGSKVSSEEREEQLINELVDLLGDEQSESSSQNGSMKNESMSSSQLEVYENNIYDIVERKIISSESNQETEGSAESYTTYLEGNNDEEDVSKRTKTQNETENEKSRKRLSYLTNHGEALWNRFHEMQNKCFRLQDELRLFKGECLRNEIKMKEEHNLEIQQVKTELEQRRKRVDESQNEFCEIMELNKLYRVDIDENQKQFNEQIESYKSEIETLKNQNREYDQTITRLKTEKEELDSSLQRALQTTEKCQSMLDEAQSLHDEYQKKIDKILKANHTLNQDNEKIQNELQIAEKELEQNNGKLQKCETGTKELTLQNENLLKYIRELEEKYGQIQEEMQNLIKTDAQNNTLTERVSELERLNGNLKKQVSQEKAEHEGVSQINMQFTKEIESLTYQIKELETINQNQSKEILLQKKNYGKLSTDKNDEHQQLLDSCKQKCENEKSDMENQIANQTKEIRALQLQRGELREKLDQAQKLYDELTTKRDHEPVITVKSTKTDLDRVRSSLAICIDQNNEYVKKIKILEEKQLNNKSVITDLEEQIKRHRKDHDSTSVQWSELCNDVSNINNVNTTLKAKNKELQEQIESLQREMPIQLSYEAINKKLGITQDDVGSTPEEVIISKLDSFFEQYTEQKRDNFMYYELIRNIKSIFESATQKEFHTHELLDIATNFVDNCQAKPKAKKQPIHPLLKQEESEEMTELRKECYQLSTQNTELTNELATLKATWGAMVADIADQQSQLHTKSEKFGSYFTDMFSNLVSPLQEIFEIEDWYLTPENLSHLTMTMSQITRIFLLSTNENNREMYVEWKENLLRENYQPQH